MARVMGGGRGEGGEERPSGQSIGQQKEVVAGDWV